MSDVPELRELIRGVAERRTRRRRRVFALRLAVPVAAVAAAIVLLPGNDGGGNDEVPAVTTPAPTETPAPNPFAPVLRDPSTPPATLDEARTQAEQVLGVFRRPARAHDRPDSRPKPRTSLRIPQKPDWTRARRIRQRGDFEQFVMPGLWDGQTGLCMAGQLKGRTISVGCDPGFPTLAFPYWSRTSDRKGPIYFVLFPDGVDRITLRLKSGEEVERRLHDNALQFQQRGLAEITWRDDSGREHRKRLVV